MSALSRYERQAVDLEYARPRRQRVVSQFIHPDIDEILGIKAREWSSRLGAVKDSGVPMAGLGFSGPPLPNAEPANAPGAQTGGTAEVNLYTPATTTNADWALLPQGSMRAAQTWHIYAAGVVTSNGAGQTVGLTARLGTSGTPASNVTLGATGLVALGSTISNALWDYQGFMTITAIGTSAKATCWGNFDVGQQAGASTSSNRGKHGNTTATFDSTLQQGFVISETPSAAGVSMQLIQFILIADD